MESVFIFCLLQTGFSPDFELGWKDLHLFRNKIIKYNQVWLAVSFTVTINIIILIASGSFYLVGSTKESTPECLIFTVVFVCLNLANSKFPLPTSLSLSISVGGGGPSAVVNTNSEQEHM